MTILMTEELLDQQQKVMLSVNMKNSLMSAAEEQRTTVSDILRKLAENWLALGQVERARALGQIPPENDPMARRNGTSKPKPPATPFPPAKKFNRRDQ